MKICVSLITSFALLATQAHSESFTLEVSGTPETAPIYVLEGTATTTFLVEESINVIQNLTYSMDSAAKGIVRPIGAMTIKRELQTDGETYYLSEWDAKLSADSEYRIKNYGRFIVAEFNHKLKSDDGTAHIIDGEPCAEAIISSIGRMYLANEEDTFEFEGFMRGRVLGFDDNGRSVRNYGYSRVGFTQNISDLTSKPGWGSWSGSYDIEQTGRKLEGEGTLKIGSSDFPFDTITQNIKGSYNSKKDVFSWNAAGSDVADKRVTVKITHNGADEVIDGKNRIRAAAQNRKF
jgi:hypothetical protein